MSERQSQPGIVADVPSHARYLFFDLRPGASALQLRDALALVDTTQHVVGLGDTALQCLGLTPGGMRQPPRWAITRGCGVWVWLRGSDAGTLAREGIRLALEADNVLELTDAVDGFKHLDGRDLTGYVDGTENPGGEAARAAAFDSVGASCVAVQRWRHDFAAWDDLDIAAQDAVIGRQISDNEEIDDAPASAHVKRTAQEDFEPEAFVLRRSMPWAAGPEAGLMFVAFGHTFDAFEAQLARMYGRDDGIEDALLGISTPRELAYLWCPPITSAGLDLD